MFRKKIPPPANPVLSGDDQKKIASFFILMLNVERRVSKEKENRNASRRNAKLSQRKNEKLGSHIKLAFIILYQQFYEVLGMGGLLLSLTGCETLE